jgi:biopolymer transport protein TolR
MNRPEINVTPLIDVLLVLLIIFMVVTPMKPSSFDARIPSEPTKDPDVQSPPDTLIVSYASDGVIHINREPTIAAIVNTSDLSGRLQEIFRLREENANRERTVFIKAPTTLDYGSVAKLIDAVKLGGADPISLQIDDLD